LSGDAIPDWFASMLDAGELALAGELGERALDGAQAQVGELPRHVPRADSVVAWGGCQARLTASSMAWSESVISAG
jgi:hypothetical protein